MKTITIPGTKQLEIKYLVFDFNGTLAIDGQLIPGVEERLKELSSMLEIHVITADTFGNAKEALKNIECEFVKAEVEDQVQQKLDYVLELGPSSVAAFGNGMNDEAMLKNAALSIALIQEEGVAAKSLLAADIVMKSINDALDLFRKKLRLKATLRT